ncbi:MAG: hypothetical protein OHK0029_04640 [Armatimonadaceae bacterium]
MQIQQITEADLEPIIRDHPGNCAFAEALERVGSPEELVRVLGRYTFFNATFGAGIASLAAKIGTRVDMFRDPKEPVALLSDRSMEIAADFFVAAVDEFDDRATVHKDTHRALAQATLRATLEFFQFTPERANQFATINDTTRKAVVAVHKGYGVGHLLTDADIFQAIGFHIGSEVLAQGERHHLDQCLQDRFPELAAHLENATVFVEGEGHAAYCWVRTHHTQEGFFAVALSGANRALQFYVGNLTPKEAKEQILAGVREFGSLQESFMAAIDQ